MDVEKKIRLSASFVSLEEENAVSRIMKKGFFGMGSEVYEFEKELSIFFGKNATCVVNGTAALHLALQAIGVAKGDEVLVPSLTYVATFQAITATGATPVACDVNPDTLQVSLEDLRKKISIRSKAIIPVHYGGGAEGIDEILKVAKDRNIRVIEDAAHAFGSRQDNRLIGTFGDITCFSFDGIKNITSGEGGCIVTADEEVIKNIKDIRLLGVIKDSDKRYQNKRSWEFEVTQQGWRYHMSDIMASIGREQLKKIEVIKERRQELAKRYDENLHDEKKISLFKRNYDQIIPHIYPIRLNKNIDRTYLRQSMEGYQIETGYHYQPNHTLEFFKKKDEVLVETNKLSKELLSLPLHPNLTLENVDFICEKLKISLNNYK